MGKRCRDIKRENLSREIRLANPYPNREIDLNCSFFVAVFRVLRRQDWKTLAVRKWATISRCFALN
jgi:hypothetical protein